MSKALGTGRDSGRDKPVAISLEEPRPLLDEGTYTAICTAATVVECTSFAMVDIGIRYPQAFSIATDIIP